MGSCLKKGYYVRRVRILHIILFCVSVLPFYSIAVLYVGRVSVRSGVAVSAIVDTTYLTETCIDKYRGAVVSSNELMITVGLSLSFLMDIYSLTIT